MNAIDTNVLVYAFDLDEPVKGESAIQLLEQATPTTTVLLWQVACELSNVLTRVGPRAKNVAAPREAIDSVLAKLDLVLPRSDMLHEAWRVRQAHQLSWGDAMLIAGCLDAGVDRLFTEDLQSKPVIEGIEIINPFAQS